MASSRPELMSDTASEADAPHPLADPPRSKRRFPIRTPKSLLARTGLTLAISALAIVLITLVALNLFVVQPIAARSADHEAALMVLSAQTWMELPQAARASFELEMAEQHDIIIVDQPRPLPLVSVSGTYLPLLQQALNQRLGEDVLLRSADDLIWAEMNMDGVPLQIGTASTRFSLSPLYIGLIISVLGAAVVTATSLIFVRRIARPLAKVSRALRGFRGASNAPQLPETGPRELVALARGFNTMAEEVSDMLASRTTLMVGISHDLRTPLARMRIAAELLPDDLADTHRTRLLRNLEEMESLIETALAFARGLHSDRTERINPSEWLADYIASMPEQERISQRDLSSAALRNHTQAEVPVDGLKRVLLNLVGNALQHTHGPVAIEQELHSVAGGNQGQVTTLWSIRVLDHGEGISEALREKVFLPFYRLEQSRSRKTGGSGLGLAIVKQLCVANGWEVSLSAAEGGGASFLIEIPLLLEHQHARRQEAEELKQIVTKSGAEEIGA